MTLLLADLFRHAIRVPTVRKNRIRKTASPSSALCFVGNALPVAMGCADGSGGDDANGRAIPSKCRGLTLSLFFDGGYCFWHLPCVCTDLLTVRALRHHVLPNPGEGLDHNSNHAGSSGRAYAAWCGCGSPPRSCPYPPGRALASSDMQPDGLLCSQHGSGHLIGHESDQCAPQREHVRRRQEQDAVQRGVATHLPVQDCR